MKVTVILVVTGALGTFLKGLKRGLEELEDGGQIETDVPNYRIVEINQKIERLRET